MHCSSDKAQTYGKARARAMDICYSDDDGYSRASSLPISLIGGSPVRQLNRRAAVMASAATGALPLSLPIPLSADDRQSHLVGRRLTNLISLFLCCLVYFKHHPQISCARHFETIVSSACRLFLSDNEPKGNDEGQGKLTSQGKHITECESISGDLQSKQPFLVPSSARDGLSLSLFFLLVLGRPTLEQSR